MSEDKEIKEKLAGDPAPKWKRLSAAGIAVVAGAAMYLAFWTVSGMESKKPESVMQAPEKIETGSVETKVKIYVTNDNLEGLSAKETGVAANLASDDKALKLARLVISEDGGKLFPAGTDVREAMVYDGTAVISMDGGFRRRFKGGAWAELLAVYAIVNTVAENIPEAPKVTFLIDDAKGDMFAKHVDISRPFKRNQKFALSEKGGRP